MFTRLTRLLFQFSDTPKTIMHTQKLQTLSNVAQSLNLQLQPPIVLPTQPVPKRKLTKEQKQQLGLYIPSSPFNPRLTHAAQKEYLPTITSQMYMSQHKNLPTLVKILQDAQGWRLSGQGWTLDQYVSLIYKDIYARYLVSKGVGVQWQSFGAEAGVMNPYSSSDSPSRKQDLQTATARLMAFVSSNAAKIKPETSIGLYSYADGCFVHPQLVQMEQVKKMSYYVKVELSRYAQFEDEFTILEEKNCKVYLLVIAQSLNQAINPQAICLQAGHRMHILKKIHQKQSQNPNGSTSNDQQQVGEYLFLPGQTFKLHQAFFKKSGYVKHSTFQSRHLHGMQCKYQLKSQDKHLPVIDEIEGYERNAGSYFVCSNHNLADFDRIKQHRIEFNQPHITDDGVFVISQQNSDHKVTMNDPFTDRKLQTILKQKGVEFIDMYGVTEQQVYFHKHTKEVLHFRLGERFTINVSGQGQSILKVLKTQNTIVEESKIVIPSFPKGKKPKERRRFRRERKQMLNQITENLYLAEAIKELTSISVTSLSGSNCIVPLFLKDGQVLPYDLVLTDEQIDKLLKGQLNHQGFRGMGESGLEVRWVNGSTSLMTGLAYISHRSGQAHDLRHVLIEPQSQVEDLVALALHLNYMSNRNKAGRRLRKVASQDGKFSLIKLHPTLSEQVKSVQLSALLQGVIKSSGKEQYGWGWQAIRLWTAKHDDYLGVRHITDESVKREMGLGQFIRKAMWELMGLLPADYMSSTEKGQKTLEDPSLYLSRFTLDMLDCYIQQMEQAYKTMNLHHAYNLTQQFFKLVLQPIFTDPVRKRIIAYPNLQQNQENFAVIARVVSASISTVAPLLPFTAYHLSKSTPLNWPQIFSPKRSYEIIPTHIKMMKLRVQVCNKLQLNRLKHAHLYLPSLKDTFSLRDLQLFFDIDTATHSAPSLAYRSCSVKLRKNNPVTGEDKLVMFESQEHCIRCDPSSSNQEYLCGGCVKYLEEEIEQGMKYHYKVEDQSKTKNMIEDL